MKTMRQCFVVVVGLGLAQWLYAENSASEPIELPSDPKPARACVITCQGMNSTMPPGGVPTDALQNQLLEGKPPAYLEPVPLDGPTPLKVWRVKP